MVEKNLKKKKIWKIGPNGTGKLVVEVVLSQVVLSDTVYHRAIKQVYTHTCPLAAAVEGSAVGGGFIASP